MDRWARLGPWIVKTASLGGHRGGVPDGNDDVRETAPKMLQEPDWWLLPKVIDNT